jgi:3-deoxy-7-phosphoheptulonate synthase
VLTAQANETRDLRVEAIRSLLPPALLLEQLPLSTSQAARVVVAREQVRRILDRCDDRLVVVVGPCSIHDPVAALDYASRLKALADELNRDLYVVMRVYFEKPRTIVGWKGLVNDPRLDGSFAINDGLRVARALLLDILGIGLAAGCEFLDPISPQYFSDAVVWGAIGARTVESQVHRQLASGLSTPVGFKNATDGSIHVAVDGIRAAAQPHCFFGVTDRGLAAIVTTRGNPDCHLILRGGRSGPNYDSTSVQSAAAALRMAGLPTRLMVDASHGNSGKDHRRQVDIVTEVGAQIAAGERAIVGVMLESFLVEGRQNPEQSPLTYGQSVTDACIGWDTTVAVLRRLAEAVRARRLCQGTCC